MGHGFITARVVRVPGGFLLVRQQIHAVQDGFCLDRIGIHPEGFLGLFGGLGVVVILERETRQQFLGLDQLWVQAERLAGQLRRIRPETVGGRQRRAEVRRAESLFKPRASPKRSAASLI